MWCASFTGQWTRGDGRGYPVEIREHADKSAEGAEGRRQEKASGKQVLKGMTPSWNPWGHTGCRARTAGGLSADESGECRRWEGTAE